MIGLAHGATTVHTDDMQHSTHQGAATVKVAEIACQQPRQAYLKTENLDQFLASVERRAFRIARFGLGNDDDALDAVQDAMLKLVKSYQQKPAEEWAALFHRILQNCITDIQRRHQTRKKWISWFDRESNDADETYSDTSNLLIDTITPDGELHLALEQGLEQLDSSIESLPRQQQQVFLLRCWEGLSTRDTAAAVGCSEGSVKTHYFRALKALKEALVEHRP